MVDQNDVARQLGDSLNLSVPPIAVSFADEIPDGVPPYDAAAAAGCQFWEQAAQGPFATSTADHALCAIGVHTHNLQAPPPSHSAELGAALKVMNELNYVTEQEVAEIPVLQRARRAM